MRRALLFSFLLLMCTPLCWGQSQVTTGIIQGAVTDPTGAAVPGAKVEVSGKAVIFLEGFSQIL